MKENKNKKSWLPLLLFLVSFIFQISYSLSAFSASYTKFNSKEIHVNKTEDKKEDTSGNLAFEEETEKDDDKFQDELISFSSHYIPLFEIYTNKSIIGFLNNSNTIPASQENIIISLRNIRI